MTATPDGSRQLSDGLLIEGSLTARLLGLRLLSIDTRIVVAPAALREGSAPSAPAARRVGAAPLGAALARAERCLDEGAAQLAALPQRAAADPPG